MVCIGMKIISGKFFLYKYKYKKSHLVTYNNCQDLSVLQKSVVAQAYQNIAEYQTA